MAKDRRFTYLSFVLITALGLLIAITADVASPRAVEAADVGITPELLAAAKKEGQITYYSSADLPLANRLKAAFETQYGIKVSILRLSASLLFNRTVQEFDTGVNVADVFETTVVAHSVDMKSKGMLQPFTPASVGLYRSPAFFDPDHYWHAARIYLSSINYNKDLLKGDMVPKTWKDLTDPKYKDKVAQGHLKVSGTGAHLDYNLVKLYGWQYFEALRRNNILTLQSCAQNDLLSRGERLLILCDYSTVYTARLQNLPMIAGVLPQDGVFVIVGPTAVLAKAPHPNAAKAFVNWLLSPEGQTLYVQGGVMSPLDSPDVKYPTDFPDVKRLKLIETNQSDFRKWLPGGVEKFAELFGG